MRARVPVLIAPAIAVLLGIAIPIPAGAAQEHRSTARPGSSWVLLAADRVSAVVLDVLEATEPAPAPPPPPPPPPPPAVSDPGTWIWPGNGPITSHFGRRWGRAHTGVDIDAPTGSAVIAPHRGTVTLAGWKNGYGLTVIIDHGEGITTLNGHLSRVAVSVGQVVDQGHYLGAVGATGNVTAAHLHYEVHVGGVPRNPVPWLQGPKAPPPPPPPPPPPAQLRPNKAVS